MKNKTLSSLFICILSLFILTACSSDSDYETEPDESVITDEELDTMFDTPEAEPAGEATPYTEEELESDPDAPSDNPDDYNSDGEYVPNDGPTENPADYNSEGEYKPVEDMTQEEIEEELESMMGDSLGQ